MDKDNEKSVELLIFANTMSPASIILLTIVGMLYLSIVLFILLDDGDSGWKVTWLLVIAIFPIVGLVIYMLCGVHYRRFGIMNRLHGKVIERFRAEIPPGLAGQLFSDDALEKVEERYRPLVRLLLGGNPGNKLSEGNSLEIITTGERKWELLKKDIAAAQKFIHIEYFRLGNDKAGREIRDLLMVRAREGVQVRYIHEGFANRQIPWRYYREMKEAGVEVKRFSNPRNGLLNYWLRLDSRNHRKIVVIDGKVAYTGGMNINNNYRYKWRDTHLRLEGPVIHSLQASFIDTWLTSGGTLPEPLPAYFCPDVRGGEGPLKDNLIQIVTDEPDFPFPNVQFSYEWILQNVRDYIYLENPYFGPPEPVINALKSAALRGVDVRLILPYKVDTPFIGPVNRSFYTECMEAGIRVYQWKGEFIHCKTVVCDDYLTLTGASNMDVRSFQINHEVNAYVYGREMALASKKIFLQDLERCQEVNLQQWKASRKWYDVLLGRILRLADSVL